MRNPMFSLFPYHGDDDVSQDPVMFSGTLRMNLDPFDKHSDDEIWRALELSRLKPYVLSLPEGLQFTCTERGENFRLVYLVL